MAEESVLDGVLNYEEECYEEGYKEGFEKGKEQGHLEGRELGIQTGFQRFLSVGILKGRVHVWKQVEQEARVQKLIDRLDGYLEITDLTNDPVVVSDIDLRVRKAKTQAKLVASTLRAPGVEIFDDKIIYQREETIEEL